MKKLLLLLSLLSQVVIGADKVAFEVLNFTKEQYRELEDFQNDDRAYQIILRTTGKSPAELAGDGYAYLAKIMQGFNKRNISETQLYNITEAIILQIDTLITVINRMKEVEVEVARAAKEVAILYDLANNKHAASIIEVKEGTSVQKIAQFSFAELAKNADWYEKGLVSDRMVCNTAKYLVENVHRIVNSIKDETPYLFEKGKYGRRKSI